MIEAVNDFLSDWNQRVIESLGGYFIAAVVLFGWHINKVHKSIAEMVTEATERLDTRLDTIIEDVQEIERDVRRLPVTEGDYIRLRASIRDRLKQIKAERDEDDPDEE